MKEITVQELKAWRESNKDFQLIDVRETYEYEWGNIGAENMPLDTVIGNLDKLSNNKEVVMHCKSGKRASALIDLLERQHNRNNLINLTGGIEAWSNEIDSTILIA